MGEKARKERCGAPLCGTLSTLLGKITTFSWNSLISSWNNLAWPVLRY